jgi:preprotein translocase SecE subunit
MEEILSQMQQARRSQRNEVEMNTEVVRQNPVNRVIGFLREVKGEMDKVTWPDKSQFRQLSIYVVIFSLLVGLLIAGIDFILQGILVQLIPSIFGR